MNNRRRWLFAQQARWFTSQFDADAIAQRARIVADGGSVSDFAALQSIIQGLKTAEVYDNALALWDYKCGAKLDGSNYVSAWYDFSGKNNDAAQATGSAQPLWSANGLSFDGSSDRMVFPAIILKPVTIIARVKRAEVNVYHTIIGRFTDNALNLIINTDNKVYLRVSNNYYGPTTETVGTDEVVISATITSGGAVVIYINGTSYYTGSGANPTVGTTIIGDGYSSLKLKGNEKRIFLFDTALTQTQIQTISAL